MKDLYVRIKVSRLTFCRAHADKNVKHRLNEVEMETNNPVRSLLQQMGMIELIEKTNK